jgi:hypothetical protein
MRQGTCCECGLTTSIRSFYSFNGKTYCEPCVWKASREAKERGEPSDYISLTDNSICARCGAYSGDTADHPIVGKLPLCPNCAPQVSNWPYPMWLKAALAGLLLLLTLRSCTDASIFTLAEPCTSGSGSLKRNVCGGTSLFARNAAYCPRFGQGSLACG